jgi:hypothetical protein
METGGDGQADGSRGWRPDHSDDQSQRQTATSKRCRSPKLGPLDGFKTYDPTTKTTKDDLNTTGERVIQQVLIAKSTDVKELPEVRLAYFDPVARRTGLPSNRRSNLS